MEISKNILNLLFSFLPSFSIFIASIGILWGLHWLFVGRHPEFGSERKFPFQILMLILSIISLLAIVMTLPINTDSRDQIMSLIGVLLSGIFAFSSTNIISNLVAGILLRITEPFKTGDFIKVDNFFGRVSERGLFDTEIQSENREFIALPNAYLVKNPILAIPNKDAIVSTKLSLGYDVHHLKVEPLLIKAARECGLEHPFVHILELGDFSVTYKISGLLKEAKGFITTRSNLSRSILDALHGEGIEIVSPTFMNQRHISEDKKIIPTFVKEPITKNGVEAEKIVFDKAEKAEKAEEKKQELIDGIEHLKSTLENTLDENKDKVKESIEAKRKRLKVVEKKEEQLNS